MRRHRSVFNVTSQLTVAWTMAFAQEQVVLANVFMVLLLVGLVAM